ncbi:MAG: YlcI/YnfO family protein [Ideonella sp.]
MKSAQLPPVRVEPAVRSEIEGALRDGESLSEFVETAALEVARRRKAQAEFLARGRASLAKARRSGEFYDADQALAAMQRRLEARMQPARLDKETPRKDEKAGRSK